MKESSQESGLEIPASARFEMERDQAETEGPAEGKITDAGRQRLEAIKGGFSSFKDRLIGRFKGMGKDIESGVVAVLSAPEAAAAGGRAVGHAAAETGRAAGHAAAETGRAVKHSAEQVGHGMKTGAEFAVGATIYGAEKVGHGVKRGAEAAKAGAEAAVQKGHEKIGAGKEWVVDRAANIGHRAVELRNQFTSRVEGIRENARNAHAEWKAERQTQKEFIEYLELCSKRDELAAKMGRISGQLSPLEQKFGATLSV